MTVTLMQGEYRVVSNVAPFNNELRDPDPLPDINGGAASNISVGDMDIMKVASEELVQLADKLIEVLGEAVRVRVREQADECDVCLKERMKTYNLCHQSSPENSLNAEPGQSDGELHDGISSVKLTEGERLMERGSPRPENESAADKSVCSHARTAVLFSGGIDSLVLTALADR